MTIKQSLILLAALSTVSCGDWLDVVSKAETTGSEMFKTADGFYASITGVYISMADSTLYGGRLPMTLLEPLTQQYYLSGNDASRELWASGFDYSVTQAETILSKLWLNMYNSIVNCNLLIHNVRTDKRELFEEGVSDVMLGEALGMRGFMYFDLVRMFNESPGTNPESSNVPYKTDFGLAIGSKLTTGKLLENVVADLIEARILLLTADPQKSGRIYSDKYVAYSRNQRMNYYAATALLARVYLYTGDHAKAYLCAMEVIESGKYRFIDKSEIVQTNIYGKEVKVDRIFMPELIFGLYSENPAIISKKWYEGYVGDLARSLNCYDPSDIRRNAWHVVNSIKGFNMIKYQRSSEKDEQSKYGDPIVPMLRLSEMYLIAAECAMADPSTGGDPVALLNELKSSRGATQLPSGASQSDIRKAITREYICEFRGEGQLRHYYKRNDMTAIDNGNYLGTTVSVPIASYTFPVPQYEIDYGWVTGK